MKKTTWGTTVGGPTTLDGTIITRERLRQLLQLCHPDKHGNSQTSQDVTCWLLEVRKKLDGKKNSSV